MTSNENKDKKPITLWILLGVSVLPIVAAYFIYFTGIGMPDNTVNAGTLLPNAQSLHPLSTEDEWQRISEDKKWRVLIPVPEHCDDACKKNLYTTRQVHIRLSERSVRVERLALVLAPSDEKRNAIQVQLKKDHPKLHFLNASTEAWKQWKNSISFPQNSELTPALIESDAFYFLVDQEGRAMMVYTELQHGNDVLKDIKRALKFSIDYQ